MRGTTFLAGTFELVMNPRVPYSRSQCIMSHLNQKVNRTVLCTATEEYVHLRMIGTVAHLVTYATGLATTIRS